MKKVFLIVSFALGLVAGTAHAEHPTGGRVQLLRDETFEQNLRWENSADKTVTPAKFLRWVMGLRGQVVSEPSNTEFQPIFNTRDGKVRFVFALAYKF